jgi:hypothetical protein
MPIRQRRKHLCATTPVDIDQFCEDLLVLVLVLVLVLEWKRRSGLRRLHVGLVGIVSGSVPSATLYQTFEHEDEHDLVAATPLCDLR